jgi:hypothetical protein
MSVRLFPAVHGHIADSVRDDEPGPLANLGGSIGAGKKRLRVILRAALLGRPLPDAAHAQRTGSSVDPCGVEVGHGGAGRVTICVGDILGDALVRPAVLWLGSVACWRQVPCSTELNGGGERA